MNNKKHSPCHYRVTRHHVRSHTHYMTPLCDVTQLVLAVSCSSADAMMSTLVTPDSFTVSGNTCELYSADGWFEPRPETTIPTNRGFAVLEKKQFLTLLGLELRPLGRPARSQPLYRLRYPSSPHCNRLYSNIAKFIYLGTRVNAS
jgi:hypothetical protein